MVMGLGGSAIAAGGPAVPKATMAAITAEKAAAGLTRRCASFVARHTGRLPVDILGLRRARTGRACGECSG